MDAHHGAVGTAESKSQHVGVVVWIGRKDQSVEFVNGIRISAEPSSVLARIA